MITIEDINRVTAEMVEQRKLTDKKPSGFLVLDQEGYLVPEHNQSMLLAVAKVTDCAGYSLVEKEIGACLVTSETIKIIRKDPAFRKLSTATREAIETALAAIE